MATTAADVTPEEQAAYVARLRDREARLQAARAARRERAWELARRAAALLRERYGAARVVVFGSLAKGYFQERSDVDLAAWGIDAGARYDAIGDLLELGDDIELNLVAIPEVHANVLIAIERDGIDV